MMATGIETLWLQAAPKFESIESFFTQKKDCPADVILDSAIASLQWFVIDNFLCFINHETNETYQTNLNLVRRLLDSPEIESYSLNVDGLLIPAIVRSQEFLKLARFFFEYLNKNELEFIKHNRNFLLWSMRSALIHQLALPIPSGKILNEAQAYAAQFDEFLADENERETPLIKWKIAIELVQIMTEFGHMDSAKKYVELATKLSNIQYDLVGEMGKRTRFQEKALPQLKVKLCRKFEIEETESVTTIAPPIDVKSDDPTLLPDVKYDGNEPNTELVKLKILEQAMMLAMMRFQHRYTPSNDEIKKEEQVTFLTYLIKYSDCWNVKFCLLELRCQYERTKGKLVERAMKQFEALGNAIRKPADGDFAVLAQQRLNNCFLALNNPFWILDKHLADLLCSLGLYKAALDVYLRIEQWTDVIDCYRRLGMQDKAAELVRKKLEQDDNQPDLHCLLGEITGDLKCYEYALKLTDARYAPALKKLGQHYFEAKDWANSLKYYQNSVDINPLQPDIWFRIGCIGLMREDWNLAVTSFRKALLYGGDTAEGWNNLSKAYIKLDKKELALKTLQEALKCAYDNWMIWENYLAVALDVDDLSEAIRAFNQLIDLKGQYFDYPLARKLVFKVWTDDHTFISPCIELFRRFFATGYRSRLALSLYARLLILLGGDNEFIIEDTVNRRLELLSYGWEKDVDKTINVLDLYKDANDLFNLSDINNSNEFRRELLHYMKLVYKYVIDLVEKNQAELSVPDLDKRKELKEKKKMLDSVYNSIIDQVLN